MVGYTTSTLQPIYLGTLRTELAYFKDQLTAEQRGRGEDRQRTEQAEATVEVLKQQLVAFKEQVGQMRKTERAKDEEHRRLKDEKSSLIRAQEETKASVMKMWDQLEKKDREVDALKSKLHGSQPSHMQGGPPVHGSMRGVPLGQMNGHPNHQGMAQRPLHMQPQSVPLRAQTHVSVVARTSCTWLRCARFRASILAPLCLADAASTSTSRSVRCTSA